LVVRVFADSITVQVYAIGASRVKSDGRIEERCHQTKTSQDLEHDERSASTSSRKIAPAEIKKKKIVRE